MNLRQKIIHALFKLSLGLVAREANKTAVEKGWWKENRNESELIMLMVCECSEAVEALRSGDPPSEHIHGFSSVEEELADVIIRIMDYAFTYGYSVADAVIAKMEFNKTREYMHGGKKF